MFGIGEEEINAVAETIRKGCLTRFQGGPEGYLARSERELAKKIGVRHALVVNSGTSALISGMVALGIGPSDEVLVSAYTWISTPLAPMLLGAIPRLVEIDDSLTMDPDDLVRKITPHTKAILVIHMANRPCDMDRILAIAQAHGIPVVEDACQAVGGLYKGKRLGSIGVIGCFSFNNYKNISCGEGGALLTDDDLLYDRARNWHDAGTFVQAYDAKVNVPLFAGQDYRASEIQGALLFEQLKRLDPGMAMWRERVRWATDLICRSGKYDIAPHRDPETAVNLALTFNTPAACDSFCERNKLGSIFNTAGRHVYLNWVPLVEKRAYRDDVNPFLTEAGRDVCFDETAAPRTIDILKRTVYLTPAWDESFEQVREKIASLE